MRSPDPALVRRAPFHPLLAKKLWDLPETLDLLLGHLLYGLLVGAIALFAASISESSAAAIVALAFTIGSWVLDFALAGQPGVLEWVSRLSLTQTLRGFILVKLERVMPHVTIRLATTGQSMVGSTSEEAYGEVEYSYGGRSDKSRSTSHREVLPLIYALAGRQAPTPIAGEEYPGYPLLANASPALARFLGGLPLLIVVAWWLSRRPPQIAPQLIKEVIKEGGQA